MRAAGGSVAARTPAEPSPGADELLVTVRQYAGGGEHLAEKVGGPPPRAGIERFVFSGEPTGGEVGEQRRAVALAQPVER